MLGMIQRNQVMGMILIGLTACQTSPPEKQASFLDGKISKVSNEVFEASLSKHPELSAYLHLAMINNSGLKAAFSQWKAALEKIPQVKALPDPSFTFGYFVEQVETRVGPQSRRFGFTQTFPWFGKLRLSGNRAGEQAKAAQQSYERVKSKLLYEVKETYFELFYLGKAIDLTAESVELMKHLESVAQAKFRAGNDAAEVVSAQVELGKLEDRLKSLLALRVPLRAKFNAILERDPDADLPLPELIEPSEMRLLREALFAKMIMSNPELKALEAKLREAEASLKLAQKDFYPDLSLGMDYIETDRMSGMGGEDAILIRGSFRLPLWWGKYHAKRREAMANKTAAMTMHNNRMRRLQAELAMALFAFRDAEQKMHLFGNTLTPLAKNSLDLAEQAYRSARADFSQLIDAQQELLEIQLAYQRAIADREQRLAQIEMIVGETFETFEKVETQIEATKERDVK